MPQPRQPATQIRLTLEGAEPRDIVFREVTGLGSESDVGGLQGAGSWTPITLRRGLDRERGLWRWRQVVMDKGVDRARTDGAISLLNLAGTPVVTFRFVRGWPLRYTVFLGGASGTEVAMEEIVLLHDGLDVDP